MTSSTIRKDPSAQMVRSPPKNSHARASIGRLITPSSRGRGGLRMIPGWAGSRPSASEGSVSVSTSKQSSSSTGKGSGILPPERAKTRNAAISGVAWAKM